jgi:dTDP-4-amino-4,6-dideoxygalactose transaminase
VPRPFAELPPGASPLGLPVAVQDRPSAAARLAAEGIQTLELWSVPHPTLPVGDFPEAARRRRTTLVVPVHQELRAADLHRIADRVLAVADGKAG